jgi:hypothetical protein
VLKKMNKASFVGYMVLLLRTVAEIVTRVEGSSSKSVWTA